LAIFWYGVLVLYLAVLLFFSLNPWILPTATDSFFSPDKLDHAVAYGGLVIILYFCISRSAILLKNNSRLSWIISIAVAILTGILIEIAQSLWTSNRTGSIEDALANTIGTAIGLVIFSGLKFAFRKWKIREN
jgi:VanZ family protein